MSKHSEFVEVAGQRFRLGSDDENATALGAMSFHRVQAVCICHEIDGALVPTDTRNPEFLTLDPKAVRFPVGQFSVIYADPAWAYRKAKLVNRGAGGREGVPDDAARRDRGVACLDDRGP